MSTPLDPERELRCAEYALGVLDAGERRALEHALPDDPALQATLAHWNERLAPLAEAVAPIEPPARVWTRIRHDLGFAPAPGSAPRSGWLDNLRLWRWLAIGASVAALALLAVNLVWLHEAAPPAAGGVANRYLVATIARQDGIAHWTATVDLQRASLVVVPAVPPRIAAKRVTELWLIPPNAQPIPLGVFAADAPATLALPPAVVARMSARATLAVSLEPPGGSPTGLPTGPVLATGPMQGA
ncbi:anti-sigma factor [Burkholderia sp. FERM BP-3421]|uniref:anti-sigma factor n=1 Tax=Burkholderia sp. FERM BP-3421 TaxID=1494466 RepID=UPI00235F9A45|nr:anti-sigma factor [Burkholderia sp. FERM BP-3421]WDD93042.1 anti-sigma factor [Burkholderia sp. FERM BP-3421]